MKRVCAWCKRDLIPSAPMENSITHGICEKCAKRLLASLNKPIMNFLDNLEAPVMLIGSNGKVKTANKLAQWILRKDLPEMEGFDTGSVFDCLNAKLKKECGKSNHCDGCTIKIATNDTFKTGKSNIGMAAYVIQGTPEDNRPMEYLISTENVKGVVLLRIDKAGASKKFLEFLRTHM